MAAFGYYPPSGTVTWTQSDYTASSTDTICIDFNSTSYSTNIPFNPVPDDDDLKREMRERTRLDSIAAVLDLKDAHALMKPRSRKEAAPVCRCRRPSRRSSVTAVRNWRRP